MDFIDRYDVEPNNNLTRFDGIRKYYKYGDVHYILGNTYDLDANYLKSTLLKKIIKNPYPVIYARFKALLSYIVPYEKKESLWYYNLNSKESYEGRNLRSLDACLFFDRDEKFYDFMDNFIFYNDEFIGKIICYIIGPINILILLFLFINFKKAPVTAYLNFSSVLYYILLFFVNFASGYYNFGIYLFGLLSIPLYIYESRYVENKFDVSILKNLIKQEKIK